MMQGLSRIVANEMSHDDFVETYGSCSPSPTDKATESPPLQPSEGLKEEQRISSAQNLVRMRRYSKTLKTTATREPLRATRPHGAQYLSASQEDILSSVESSSGASRRNAKFQNIASRLARRSFRVVAKKKSAEGSTSLDSPTSSRPPTPSRLGAFLFKRSKSVSRQQVAAECTSFRVLTDDDRVPVQPKASTPTRTQSRERRSRVTRSMSLSPSTSLLVKPRDSQASKRHSAYSPGNWETIKPRDEVACDGASAAHKKRSDVVQRIIEQKEQILGQQRALRQEIEPNAASPAGETAPELGVSRKYESIRRNEEMRVVAIVALLNRRRNSLRIKCDRFEKDLQQQQQQQAGAVNAAGPERLKFVKDRVKLLRRKLNVVEQCIAEQQNTLELSAAKLELKCCVELFQMGLEQDQAALSAGGARALRRDPVGLNKVTLKASSSCDTLGSMEDSSVFGDSTPVSVHSLSFDNSADSPQPSSDPLKMSSPTLSKLNATNLDRNSNAAGRYRSVDCAIMSDCDSGFDNGDALSRSDISLDGTLSKSTGSIVSSCSQSGLPGAGSPCAKHNDVFRGQALDTIPDETCRAERRDGAGDSPKGEVDRSVLAKIEDFEIFAQKRIRCLSNKGKIVPLKSGS